MANQINSQDWQPVVFQKSLKELKKNPYAERESHKRHGVTNSTQCSTVTGKKIVEDGETFHVPLVGVSFGVELQKARTAKKMTQKDLASKLNERPDMIQSYENGKAQPNASFVSKINKVLGSTLKLNKVKKDVD
jgi:putative transcription factor